MDADDLAFLDTAVQRGILGLDARVEVEGLMRTVEQLGQPLGLREVIEIKGFLTPDGIAAVERAMAERQAPAIQVARPGAAASPPGGVASAGVGAAASVAPLRASATPARPGTPPSGVGGGGSGGAPAGLRPATTATPPGGLAPASPAPSAATGPNAGATAAALSTANAPPVANAPPGVLPPGAPDVARFGLDVQRPLGQSFAGPIFLAKHRQSGKLATIKVVAHPMLAEPERRQRFLDMGARLKGVSGPHVIDVFEVEMLPDGRAFVASTAVEGLSLKQKLERAIPHRTLLRMALGIARGLEALHGAGIAHGGVRPENVFLEHARRVRLAGHELSALFRHMGAEVPSPFIAEPYRAPELPPGRASRPADVYAFGAILYRGYADRAPGLEPQPLTELLAAVDPRVDQLVMSCLEPEPIRRPTVERLLRVLEPLAGAAAVEKVRE